MAKYIPLDAVVAEIEKLKEIYCYDTKTTASFVAEAVINSVNNAINSLEVKEVDDEPECNVFPRPIECYSNCKECPWLATNNKAQKGE